ncbi:MAG: hypoxanthine phosphoribosyltransferase [Planctomycetes bacterium]|nr:hypoxanthine phosphoribosyltransferase [Planctomycetota bacterium]
MNDLAEAIEADFDGRPITIAAVMTGALIFVADLVRRLPSAMRIHLVQIRSYPGRAVASQGPTLLAGPPEDLTGQDVLLIDDILDSGRTLKRAVEEFRRAGAHAVRTCVLVAKPAEVRAADGLARADYVGFEIPPVFVVGYGMDFDDCYRNLPDIAVLEGGS